MTSRSGDAEVLFSQRMDARGRDEKFPGVEDVCVCSRSVELSRPKRCRAQSSCPLVKQENRTCCRPGCSRS